MAQTHGGPSVGEFDGRVIHTRVSFGNLGTHRAFAFSLLHAPPHFVSIFGLVVGMELFSTAYSTRVGVFGASRSDARSRRPEICISHRQISPRTPSRFPRTVLDLCRPLWVCALLTFYVLEKFLECRATPSRIDLRGVWGGCTCMCDAFSGSRILGVCNHCATTLPTSVRTRAPAGRCPCRGTRSSPAGRAPSGARR